MTPDVIRALTAELLRVARLPVDHPDRAAFVARKRAALAGVAS